MSTLNIHEFYNKLKTVGFNEQQADMIANIQNKTAIAAIEQTKQELELKLTTQLEVKVTKFVNQALAAVCVLTVGVLIKMAIFH